MNTNPYYHKIENLNIKFNDTPIVNKKLQIGGKRCLTAIRNEAVLDKEQQKFLSTYLDNNIVPCDFFVSYLDNPEKFLSIIPKPLLEVEVPIVTLQTIGNGYVVPPHKDFYRKTNVNFYTAVNGERTCFYTSDYKGIQLGGKSQLKKYPDGVFMPKNDNWMPNKIKTETEFISNNNELYILNVEKIHAIDGFKPNFFRKSISFGFKLDYYSVIDYFNT